MCVVIHVGLLGLIVAHFYEYEIIIYICGSWKTPTKQHQWTYENARISSS